MENTSNSGINLDNYFNNFSCPYRLPCGICSRTGDECAKKDWSPSWTWSPLSIPWGGTTPGKMGWTTTTINNSTGLQVDTTSTEGKNHD